MRDVQVIWRGRPRPCLLSSGLRPL